MDVLFRQFLRMVVGGPGNLDWSRPWHHILREWNMNVQTTVSEHFVSFHFISFQISSFRFISFHFISFHFISSHFISFHP